MLRKRSGAAVPHQCRQLLSGLRGLGAAESGASVDGGGDGASGASAAAYGGHVEAACCAMSAVEHGFLVDGEESDGEPSMDSGHQAEGFEIFGRVLVVVLQRMASAFLLPDSLRVPWRPKWSSFREREAL